MFGEPVDFKHFRLMKESTWESMHHDPSVVRDVGYDAPGISPTSFTQGGINLFQYDFSKV